MAQPPPQMPPGGSPPQGVPIQFPGGGPPIQPGQQPTPDQIRAIQAQITADAQRAGLSVPEFMQRMRAQAMQQAQMRQQMMQQQQGGQGPAPPGQGQPGPQQGGPMPPPGARPGQQVPIQPGPPKPEAIALAKFLRGQDLKMRTCIFQEKRKDMFRVKRAIRAIQSPAYEKARKKEPLLPAVTDRATAENCFKLLPLSLLALRVSKIDPDQPDAHGHKHKPKKRTKGLWNVKVEPQQEAADDYHYVMLWEGAQWRNKLYAAGALVGILAVVFFPVWPYHLRLGVWYLSMAMLGLLGLFFAMAIFRLLLFLITMFAKPPGLWLYPNLFEDVGFFDSFKPMWAWHEDEKAVKQRKKEERLRKKAKREAKANGAGAETGGKKSGKAEQKSETPSPAPAADAATATGARSTPQEATTQVQQRNLKARVEEVEE
ncbi:translocation protein [Polychaeton citri CBS 116435]|uniref:Translocation protein SEC62 n=1 Tax=Polychaeton citri CBS 116435 TaxID=1314669 RepID=A0A9P4QBY1_9PEZI|nr:translocation protein [Polychaeton citri CBS 116435]